VNLLNLKSEEGAKKPLMIMRKRTREIAMELLYQSTMNQKTPEDLMDEYFEDNHDDLREDTDMEYLGNVLKGVESHKEQIDKIIEKYLVKWKLPRISKINLSILRLATYEILFIDDIPNNVSIFEAVDMTKKYSDDVSGAFINGVLDKISHMESKTSFETVTEAETEIKPETEAEVEPEIEAETEPEIEAETEPEKK